MKTVTITELKNRLSALLDLVRNGSTIIVLDRNQPIAKLTSAVDNENSEASNRLLRLERAGLIRRGTKIRNLAQLLDTPAPKPSKKESLVQIFLEERRASR